MKNYIVWPDTSFSTWSPSRIEILGTCLHIHDLYIYHPILWHASRYSRVGQDIVHNFTRSLKLSYSQKNKKSKPNPADFASSKAALAEKALVPQTRTTPLSSHQTLPRRREKNKGTTTQARMPRFLREILRLANLRGTVRAFWPVRGYFFVLRAAEDIALITGFNYIGAPRALNHLALCSVVARARMMRICCARGGGGQVHWRARGARRFVPWFYWRSHWEFGASWRDGVWELLPGARWDLGRVVYELQLRGFKFIFQLLWFGITRIEECASIYGAGFFFLVRCSVWLRILVLTR